MKRLIRSLVVAVFVLGLGGAVASASTGTTPSIAGVSAHVVNRFQDLVITGSNFSNDISTADCKVSGASTVHFIPLSGASTIDASVAGTDSAHCTNTSVHVAVPGNLTGGARVSLSDNSGHTSNNNQVVTVVPSGLLSPSAGPVSATSTITGSGLKPGSLVVPGNATLTVGGQPRTLNAAAWTDGGLPFDPKNTGGSVVLSFSVLNDFSKPSDGSVPSNLSRIDFNAGNYTFQPPSPDQSTFAHQSVGNRFHVSGQYLGSGGTVTFPGGASQRGASWGSTGFDATVPAGAQPGALTVNVDGFGNVTGPTLQLDPKVSGMNPAATSAGQPIRVTGYNFGGSPGKVRVGSAEQSVANWSDQAVTFTLGADADGGVVTVTRADGAAVDAANLSVLPRIDKFETNNIVSGGQVVLDGVSLGSDTGTAAIGGSAAQPLLWSRTSVLLQLPPTLGPGSYPVTLVNAAGARSNALSLTIVAAPTLAPGTSAKPGVTQAGGSLAPSYDNNHAFVKPIKPPSPVFFNVSTDPHTVRAGETADVVVILKLNDKPLSGAQVKLEMLFTPGSDYTFTPASGVTDATGTFRSKVKVSKTPGDSIIAATSGVFSDQDHVAGTGADGKTVPAATQTNPASQNSGFAPLAIIGVLAVAMVAAGFYLNIRSMSAS